MHHADRADVRSLFEIKGKKRGNGRERERKEKRQEKSCLSLQRNSRKERPKVSRTCLLKGPLHLNTD